MLDLFQNHLQDELPFLKEKRLLVAVSGGIDSMVLLHLLYQLKYSIEVAHCNFQLRGAESDGDEAFVRKVCSELKVPFHLQQFDTKKIAESSKQSIQLTARKLRYDWFYEVLEKEQCDYILTAHHLDDSLETFFINLSRGTGLEGLTGIPMQNDKIIRPLLGFARNALMDYAEKNAIQWREDSSNASDKYLRNKLRHDVIPILKELNPNFLESFLKTQNYLKEAQSIVTDGKNLVYKEVVSEQTDGSLSIDCKLLIKHSNYAAYLYQWLKEYGFTAWNDIADLVYAQSGKQVFSATHILLKDRDRLILSSIKESLHKEVFAIEKNSSQVNIPLKFEFCNLSDISDSDSNSIFVDEDLLQFPLQLRKWEEGDVFHPLGMQGTKKVSKYFKDEKLSLIDKSNKWLLCSDNQIIWIVGMRQDNRFKVTTNTTRIVKITVQ
ncbi:tRNA lysidine(34) synthetase TilS [Flavobacterium sp.]|uniref:tRNA lysidine(34) synthetase TilS n=1 Tax=Flavobacterium sp. TaxID=239 RepID=UPI00262752DC|nr:tRNA lysidine(34) synthetase TilS [Flavobacterium sp.]